MSKNISDMPDQPLQTWTPKKNVEYITADNKNFVDLPLTHDDIEYVEREEMEIKIPEDRQLISIGAGSLLAMPKDMLAAHRKLDAIDKPISLTRLQRIKTSLLNLFRGKNAKQQR